MSISAGIGKIPRKSFACDFFYSKTTQTRFDPKMNQWRYNIYIYIYTMYIYSETNKVKKERYLIRQNNTVYKYILFLSL